MDVDQGWLCTVVPVSTHGHAGPFSFWGGYPIPSSLLGQPQLLTYHPHSLGVCFLHFSCHGGGNLFYLPRFMVSPEERLCWLPVMVAAAGSPPPHYSPATGHNFWKAGGVCSNTFQGKSVLITKLYALHLVAPYGSWLFSSTSMNLPKGSVPCAFQTS